MSFSLMAALFVFYEVARESVGGGVFAERSLIDSLNRTNVLSYLKLIDVSEVTVGFKALIKMWTDSVFVFIRSIGAPTDSLVDVFYFREEVFIPLFKDWLVLRGTPAALVGGFSLVTIS